ncbi:HEAT repeat domain-containing protein [Modestobacter marinus]|uniref:HEAT repeat domain-containing protein n=1 Tax=Modestobacter marinus TaxID=477641 RepID=A0A846LNJ8_9ACTN|nr:HEAT repeat domain-containing protein [Modestobacter marinus]NIH69017.1 hypothetical protein [Modestobacter marinus]GGL78186.1 hypothetical protein GCM10011589_37830 [Modestobacter marinus]
MVPIDTADGTPRNVLADALAADDASVRLRAALAAGTRPDPGLLERLVERCAREPDPFVRDMLSWALTRLPSEITLPRLRRELDSELPRARSQALHSLSKIGDGRAWAWLTRDLLRDPDDEVARTAWRVAVGLVPDGAEQGLVEELVAQLGRGDRDVQLSLSRAFVELGEVIEPALEGCAADADPAVAAHARATALLLRDPGIAFDTAVEEARRVAALGPERAAVIASGVTGTSEPVPTTEAVQSTGAASC